MRTMEFHYQFDTQPSQCHKGLPETFKIDVRNVKHSKIKLKIQRHMLF